jgi:hypothetical protein
MMTEIKNAQITSTMLGYEDHGILTCFVTVEGDGWGCGFGGYALDLWDESKKARLGTAYGCQFIIETMKAVGVDSWEKLKGQHVRVESEGWGGTIKRIGHITKDKWFDPKALAESMKAGS